jgi:hypothetical protein
VPPAAFETDTDVSSGGDEDFSGGRWNVLFSEMGDWGEELGEKSSPGHD